LCWRKHDLFEIEETKFFGPNVLAFQLETGGKRFYVVGCYIPPDDLDALENIKLAWEERPEGHSPLLLGDLNINLESPRSEREVEIAEQCDYMDMQDMSRQFHHGGGRQTQKRWTWRHKRRGRWEAYQPDYFMAQGRDRKRVKQVRLRQPRHHGTDHRAVIAKLYGGAEGKMKAYRQKRTTLPLRLPNGGPRTEMESIFEQLRESCEPPPARKRPANAWILETTWALVDHRAQMANGGRLTRRGYRKLSRKVRASLKRDRQKRAHEAGTTMESHLESGELQEAWRVLKGWYRMAEDKAPQPCFATMEKQTWEREELYARQVPQGTQFPSMWNPSRYEMRLLRMRKYGRWCGICGTAELAELQRYVLSTSKIGSAGSSMKRRMAMRARGIDGELFSSSSKPSGSKDASLNRCNG